MAVRTASWVFLGLLFATAAAAAERPGGPQTASNSLPVATDARLGGDKSQTRFVMDFTRKIDLRAFTLADPYRVVLDIPQVMFQLPPKTGESGRGLIKAFRFGLVMQGGSQIVFDLTKPVQIEKAFVVEASDGAPARLVLDLAATDRESFLRKSTAEAVPNRADLPRASGSGTKGSDARPLVVLDPGHGGIDTGTKGPHGEEEKDIVLDFAQRLRVRIEKTGKYRVMMTRSDDTFVPLADRVRIARDTGAALLVSIHAELATARGGRRARREYLYALRNRYRFGGRSAG